MNRLGILLAAALLAAFAPPVAAHEPSASDFEVAIATDEDVTIDADLAEDVWDDAEELEFDSPNDDETTVRFAWDPQENLLYVAVVVDDETDDAADDWIDFAFSFDHGDEEADEGDQSILRAHREGTFEQVSVEDGAVTAGEPSDFEVDSLDEGTDGYTIEMAIEWSEDHAGWAIVQEDNTDDQPYPDGADLDDPESWADVKGEKKDLDLSLVVDKSSAKLDDTLTLTATIDDFDDLNDFDESIVFQRLDGSTWTTLASKSPDDDGEAKTTTKVATTGAVKYRARVAESDLFAEALSTEVTVTVADASTKLYGDATLFVRYATDADGWRTYTMLANTTSSYPTLEASPDGVVWTRLAAGDRGTPLTATWSPPDARTWHVRFVPYDAAGKAGTAVAAELPAYTLPGTRTATTVTLDVDHDDAGADLAANVTPAAAAGTVTFYRAPNVVLGTATLAQGVAKLHVAEAFPGPQTYVARYAGSTTHAPSADRDASTWWPEDVSDFTPRTTDATGETVSLAVADGNVTFTARAGQGPGIPGAVEIWVTPEGGNATALVQDLDTDGSVRVPFRPTVVGDHALEARFYRASGTDVVVDTRTATASGAARVVTVTLDAPATATPDETVAVAVQLSPAPTGGEVTLLVDGDEVAEAAAAGEVVLNWTATAGAHTLVARYGGAEGFQAAESASATIDVGSPDDGEDDETPGERKGTPGLVWIGAVGALALAARRRRN